MPLPEMFERQAPTTAHLRQPTARNLSGTPVAAPLVGGTATAAPSVSNTVGGASVLH